MNPHTRADRAVTRRAWRRLALLATVSVTVAVTLVGAVAWLVVERAQGRAVDRQLAAALDRFDDVGDPPANITLFVRHPSGVVEGTPDAPTGPDRAALDRVAATGTAELGGRTAGGTRYRVRTQRRGEQSVQAAYDLTDSEQERQRLLMGLTLAELLGIGVAAGLGVALARRAVRPLGDALDRQRRFVADAAHELRTPLTLLHTRVQLLERAARRQADHELAAEAGEVVADSRRLGEVVEDLLLSADLAQGAGRYAEVDLSRLAGEVAAAARAHAEELGIHLVLDAAPECGPVSGVESALRRALGALVDNALGHTPPGGTVTVTVTAPGEGRRDTVAVRVSDTGSGLDPSDTARLFARFARAEQPDDQRGDRRRYGLGLALVHETVTNHGGRVEVTGAPGHGAAFTVQLPRHRH